MDLDPTDHVIIGFIERYMDEHRMCASLREIAEGTGLSHVAVWYRVQELIEAEYLMKKGHCGRTLRPGPRLRK